jgi:hypothetical protein
VDPPEVERRLAAILGAGVVGYWYLIVKSGVAVCSGCLPTITLVLRAAWSDEMGSSCECAPADPTAAP